MLRIGILGSIGLLWAPALSAADKPSTNPPPAPLEIRFPFVPGKSFVVSQGNNGAISHQGKNNRYAWDFVMPEGTPVAAVKIGRVAEIKQDSNFGGPSEEFVSQRNYVLIDHGAGYFSQYVHLRRNSVPVKVGDLVRTGQVIGLSGITGWSTGPHLHFQLVDLRGVSLPACFLEFASGGGIPGRGAACAAVPDGGLRLSGEEASHFLEEKYPGDSTIPYMAFQENKVELTSPLPARVYYSGKTYTVTGSIKFKNAKTIQLIITPRTDRARVLKTYAAEPDKKGNFTLGFVLEQPSEKWDIHPNAYGLKIVALDHRGSVVDKSDIVPIGIYPH